MNSELTEYLNRLNEAIDNLEARSDRQVYSPLAREEARSHLNHLLRGFVQYLYEESFNRGYRKAKDEIQMLTKIEKYQIKKELKNKVAKELKEELREELTNEDTVEKGV